jgi:lysophospholipase L1-like esterase
VRRWSLLVAALLAVAGVLVAPATAQATTTVPLPSSMASTGDSITRSYDATLFGCFLADCPQYSWSTGTSTSVSSEYRRILAKNAAISGHGYNDAKTGADMSALDGQLATAAGQAVQYATVLMGANDVCTSSAATMTPTATFQAEFQQALSDFFGKDPNALVFVSSIPNVYQLWSLLHTNSSARSTWSAFHICQSMLASTNTDDQRQAVQQQEQADNAALATVCAQFANCRWDDLATYDYVFTTSDVSTVDYFHPSVKGQNDLAGIAWNAGYWGA